MNLRCGASRRRSMLDRDARCAQSPRKPAATAGTTVSNPNAGSTRKTRGKSSRTGTVRARASARRRRSRRDSAARRARESLTAAPSRAPVASTEVSGAKPWIAARAFAERGLERGAEPARCEHRRERRRRPSAAPNGPRSRPLRTASSPRSTATARRSIAAGSSRASWSSRRRPRGSGSSRPAPCRRVRAGAARDRRGDSGRAGACESGGSARCEARGRARMRRRRRPRAASQTSANAPHPSASTGNVGAVTRQPSCRRRLRIQSAASGLEREPATETHHTEAGVGERHRPGGDRAPRRHRGRRPAGSRPRSPTAGPVPRARGASAAISERSRSDDARPSSASAARPPVVAATTSAPAALLTAGVVPFACPRGERGVERRSERAPAGDARELGAERAVAPPERLQRTRTVPPVRSSLATCSSATGSSAARRRAPRCRAA